MTICLFKRPILIPDSECMTEIDKIEIKDQKALLFYYYYYYVLKNTKQNCCQIAVFSTFSGSSQTVQSDRRI